MRKIKKIVSLLLSICLVASMLTGIVTAAGGSNVSITGIPSFGIEIGDTVTITIKHGAANLVAAGLYLEFDNAKLECTGITAGDGTTGLGMYYESSKGTTWSDATVADTVENTNKDGIFSLGVAGAVNGSDFREQIVAIITFKAISSGTAVFTLNENSSGTDNFKGIAQTSTLSIAEAPIPVTGVSLLETLNLTVGDSETLIAAVEPANAANKNVTWASADETVATVDAAGKVTAVKAGKTTITVTTVDGGFTDTCEVTVNEPVKPTKNITADDISIEDAGKYTGRPLTPVVTVDGLNPDDFTVSYGNNTNAGNKAYVTVSPASNGRYTFTPVTKEFTIDKADQTISASNITVTVGSGEIDLNRYFQAKGDISISIVDPSAVPSGISVDLRTKKMTVGDTAGSFRISVHAAETANYNDAEKTITVTIKEKADIIIPIVPVVTKYTLSFATNGGSAVASVTKNANSIVDLSSYTTTKDGYEFAGWYTDQALTEKVTSVKLSKNTTVYAKWIEIPASDEPEETDKPCDGGENCPSNIFIDVDQTQWYHEGIDFVVENGMMNGVGDDKFDPHGVTSRAMIVTILYRLEGEPDVNGENSFDDVQADTWYTDAVIWAEANGIVNGYGDGKFGPEDDITREQMAKIMYNYAAYKGYDISARASLASISDADKISDWAVEEMQWAVAVGLINGMGDGSVAPQRDAERCQSAAIFMRFCEKYVK